MEVNFIRVDFKEEQAKQRQGLPFLERAFTSTRYLRVRKQVQKIIAEIEKTGEAGVLKFAKKFDGFSGDNIKNIKVSESEIEASTKRISPELLSAIELAAERIRKHYSQNKNSEDIKEIEDTIERKNNSEIADGNKNVEQLNSKADTLTVATKTLPLEVAGVYVPGGNAKYPSSVLMNVIPAQVAGVKKIVVCTPPNSEGKISDEVLSAIAVASKNSNVEVYALGGIQAVAAMAFGFVAPKVDVICGPGNAFVAEALSIVSAASLVRVPPSVAGPSEIAIICDKTTDPTHLALDLLAQIEHGVDGLAFVVSWDEEIFEKLQKELNEKLENKSTFTQSGAKENIEIYVVAVKDKEQAVELINMSAPEHLQIDCELSLQQEIAAQIKNVGAVFCGLPTAIGDYVAGPSHTLPTGGSAKFSGAISLSDFQKTINIISGDISNVENKELADATITLAKAEGLELHAQSIESRL